MQARVKVFTMPDEGTRAGRILMALAMLHQQYPDAVLADDLPVLHHHHLDGTASVRVRFHSAGMVR